jgi:hypothetical protein
MRKTALETGDQGTRPYPQRGRTSSVVLSEKETDDQKIKALVATVAELRRLNRKLFNYASPVEEYEWISGAPANGIVTIRPDYDYTVMIETLLFSLPVGCTSAVLDLGSNRKIPLYSGGAITTQQLQSFTGLRHICGPDDRRTLTIAGALTGTGYISLMGHAFEREGER